MNSVVVLGASADRKKFGNKALRAYQQQGYVVYPVNPRETHIEGLAVYSAISHVPVRPEVVSVYLPPGILLPLLPEIAAKGCNELWLNPGAESSEVSAACGKTGAECDSGVQHCWPGRFSGDAVRARLRSVAIFSGGGIFQDGCAVFAIHLRDEIEADFFWTNGLA